MTTETDIKKAGMEIEAVLVKYNLAGNYLITDGDLKTDNFVMPDWAEMIVSEHEHTMMVKNQDKAEDLRNILGVMRAFSAEVFNVTAAMIATLEEEEWEYTDTVIKQAKKTLRQP